MLSASSPACVYICFSAVKDSSVAICLIQGLSIYHELLAVSQY